ncbi:MAG: DUF5664 domain-containing protein [Nitrospira sp.]|nr:DUF5664 domain-containing protein [Nitrospira sp.]
MNLDPMIGPGEGPTRATTLSNDPEGRKRQPVGTGVLDYFPDALVAVAEVSWQGNNQHNPGMTLRWTRGKSTDEADCIIRHFLQRGTRDSDELRHSAKLAWRALALLQKEIEAEQETQKRWGARPGYLPGLPSGSQGSGPGCQGGDGSGMR